MKKISECEWLSELAKVWCPKAPSNGVTYQDAAARLGITKRSARSLLTRLQRQGVVTSGVFLIGGRWARVYYPIEKNGDIKDVLRKKCERMADGVADRAWARRRTRP